MSFRNFVVVGGARETSFLPKDPKEVSYGVGSPSVSVNNNDVDALAFELIAATKLRLQVIKVNDVASFLPIPRDTCGISKGIRKHVAGYRHEPFLHPYSSLKQV